MRIAITLSCLAAIGFAQRSQLPPLRIAGNMTTIELAPVLVAANGAYRGPVTVINGGIPNLMRGEVDAATNAETQFAATVGRRSDLAGHLHRGREFLSPRGVPVGRNKV